MSRRSIYLIVLSLVFFTAAYFFSIASHNYELESLAKVGFTILHGPDELNNWDVAGLGCIVFGAACVVSSIWLRKR